MILGCLSIYLCVASRAWSCYPSVISQSHIDFRLSNKNNTPASPCNHIFACVWVFAVSPIKLPTFSLTKLELFSNWSCCFYKYSIWNPCRLYLKYCNPIGVGVHPPAVNRWTICFLGATRRRFHPFVTDGWMLMCKDRWWLDSQLLMMIRSSGRNSAICTHKSFISVLRSWKHNFCSCLVQIGRYVIANCCIDVALMRPCARVAAWSAEYALWLARAGMLCW